MTQQCRKPRHRRALCDGSLRHRHGPDYSTLKTTSPLRTMPSSSRATRSMAADPLSCALADDAAQRCSRAADRCGLTAPIARCAAIHTAPSPSADTACTAGSPAPPPDPAQRRHAPARAALPAGSQDRLWLRSDENWRVAPRGRFFRRAGAIASPAVATGLWCGAARQSSNFLPSCAKSCPMPDDHDFEPVRNEAPSPVPSPRLRWPADDTSPSVWGIRRLAISPAQAPGFGATLRRRGL